MVHEAKVVHIANKDKDLIEDDPVLTYIVCYCVFMQAICLDKVQLSS